MHTTTVVLVFALSFAVGGSAVASGSAADEPAGIAHGAHKHGKPQEKDMAEQEKKPALTAPGEAKVGDRTTCLVTGDEFTVEADTESVEHGGKTYYVCCEQCANDFKENPEKFLRPEAD